MLLLGFAAGFLLHLGCLVLITDGEMNFSHLICVNSSNTQNDGWLAAFLALSLLPYSIFILIIQGFFCYTPFWNFCRLAGTFATIGPNPHGCFRRSSH